MRSGASSQARCPRPDTRALGVGDGLGHVARRVDVGGPKGGVLAAQEQHPHGDLRQLGRVGPARPLALHGLLENLQQHRDVARGVVEAVRLLGGGELVVGRDAAEERAGGPRRA